MNILPSVCMDPLLPALGQRSKVILVASKNLVKILLPLKICGVKREQIFQLYK